MEGKVFTIGEHFFEVLIQDSPKYMTKTGCINTLIKANPPFIRWEDLHPHVKGTMIEHKMLSPKQGVPRLRLLSPIDHDKFKMALIR